MEQDHFRFPVSVSGKTYSSEFQTDPQYERGWQSVLKAGHGHTHGLCECRGKTFAHDLKLKIQHRNDRYFLARYGETGLGHDPRCRFYGETIQTTGSASTMEEAVVSNPDGTFRVTLGKGIRIATDTARTDGSQASSAPRAAGRSKRRSTLLGLLHLLWEVSELNRWSPGMEGKRIPALVSHLTNRSASLIRVSGIPLNEILLVAAAKGDSNAQRNLEVKTRASDQRQRMLAISSLSRFDNNKHVEPLQILPLAGPFGMPTMALGANVWTRAQRQFGGAVNAWRRGERIIAIALFDTAAIGSRGGGEVIDLALMRVSEGWIPVESSHELTIEKMLRSQGRHFTKPLRYRSDDDSFHPDFVLTDGDQPVSLEVFGMDTPEYLERRAEKIDILDQKFGKRGWWYWDAYTDTNGECIPDFPPARRRNNRNE